MGRTVKVLAAAALALGGISAASSPAMASGGGDLVDIKVGDITLYRLIDVDVAAAICGIDVNALNIDLNDGDNEAECPVLYPAKVIKH